MKFETLGFVLSTTCLLLLVSLCASLAQAAGYVGPGTQAPLSTAAAALEAADETPVRLEGRVVRQLDAERYIFVDPTGRIQVDIDAEDWPAAVSELTKVVLIGEVDLERGSRDVDVERVELAGSR